MKKLLTAFISMSLLLISAESHGRGFDVGNAGDYYASQFFYDAKLAVMMLRRNPPSELEAIGVDLERIEAAIKTTTLRSVEHALVDANGTEVAALNYSNHSHYGRYIEINRRMWRDIRAPSETKHRLQLVLHEYLGVLGLEVGNYEISSQLISMISVFDYDSKKWMNPINPANRISMDLESPVPGCVLPGVDFKLDEPEEVITRETRGESCGENYRQIRIHKFGGEVPPDTGLKGQFHRFHIWVFDREGQQIGFLDYRPNFLDCTGPLEGSCRHGGTNVQAGIEFVFWNRPELYAPVLNSRLKRSPVKHLNPYSDSFVSGRSQ